MSDRKLEFNKEEFKKEVVENVKTLYRKTIDEATTQEVFQAVAYAVKDEIIDQWIATRKEFDKADPKRVYYLSMEFLMGRALGNSIINLGINKEIREAGCLLPRFSGNAGIFRIWLRYPLQVRYVRTEDRERLSGRSSG